jgi:hypothetical protein
MSKPIPQVRDELLALAALDHCPPDISEAISELVHDMYRQPPTRKRAPVKVPPMSDDKQQRVAEYAKRHPNKSLHEIAAEFRVNVGRVSEALRRFA